MRGNADHRVGHGDVSGEHLIQCNDEIDNFCCFARAFNDISAAYFKLSVIVEVGRRFTRRRGYAGLHGHLHTDRYSRRLFHHRQQLRLYFWECNACRSSIKTRCHRPYGVGLINHDGGAATAIRSATRAGCTTCCGGFSHFGRIGARGDLRLQRGDVAGGRWRRGGCLAHVEHIVIECDF